MNEFAELLAGCRRGDAAAFAVVVERYLPHVRQAVRRRLSARLRARFDSTDFAQEVWASFFKVTLDRLDLPDEGALVAYLSRMAENKVLEECRHQTTLKVNIRRDVSLTELGELPDRPAGEDPADERWAAITRELTDRERAVLALLRDGHTREAVAERLGLTGRTVRRLLERLRGVPAVGGTA